MMSSTGSLTSGDAMMENSGNATPWDHIRQVAADDNLSKTAQIAIGIYLCILLIVGFVGNTLTLNVITRTKNLRTAPNVYVANLAAADLICLLVNLLPNIIEFLTNTTGVANHLYCAYTSPINIATMICSLVSIAAVGFNRYLLFCAKPGLYARVFRRRYIILSLVLIWAWSFLITVPPMAGYGEFGYHVKYRTCFFMAYDELSWMYGTIFCCVIGVFPPVILSAFFYISIMLKLRQSKEKLERHRKMTRSACHAPYPQYLTVCTNFPQPNAEKPAMIPPQNAVTDKQNRQLRKNSRHRKNILMLIVIFILVVACWMPIAISFIGDKKNTLPSLAYVLFAILAWTNSGVNIFVYAGINMQFRKAYMAILKPLQKRLNGLRSTNSSSNDGETPGELTYSISSIPPHAQATQQKGSTHQPSTSVTSATS